MPVEEQLGCLKFNATAEQILAGQGNVVRAIRLMCITASRVCKLTSARPRAEGVRWLPLRPLHRRAYSAKLASHPLRLGCLQAGATHCGDQLRRGTSPVLAAPVRSQSQKLNLALGRAAVFLRDQNLSRQRATVRSMSAMAIALDDIGGH